MNSSPRRVTVAFRHTSCRIQRPLNATGLTVTDLEHVTTTIQIRFSINVSYVHYLRTLCMSHVVPCTCHTPWAAHFRTETFTSENPISIDFTSHIIASQTSARQTES